MSSHPETDRGQHPLPLLQLRGSGNFVRRLRSTCIVIVEHHSITLRCKAAIFAFQGVSGALTAVHTCSMTVYNEHERPAPLCDRARL
jgi:hypothetical protein